MRWNRHDTDLPVVRSAGDITLGTCRNAPLRPSEGCFSSVKTVFLCDILSLMIDTRSCWDRSDDRGGQIDSTLVGGRRMMSRGSSERSLTEEAIRC